jgi:hypothetical protein
MRRRTFRLGGLPVISGLATMIVAATVDPEGNLARLRALPRDERARLIDNLNKFDLLYTPEQQRALRELDRKINELDPARQAHYLAALRRYHNWLALLPETKQDELKDKSANERMGLVKKLLADYPVPKAITNQFLRLIEAGKESPFELASMYETWQKLKPEERQQVVRITGEPRRREELFRLGEKHAIPREVKPPGFDEETSAAELETFLKKNRPVLLLEKIAKNQEARKAEILRRQAINLHFMAKVHRPKAVTPERLAEFLALFPPWLKSSFDHYPPDEAVRRLTVVYRLVYPAETEIDASPRPAADHAGGTTSPDLRRRPPVPDSKATTGSGKAPL